MERKASLSVNTLGVGRKESLALGRRSSVCKPKAPFFLENPEDGTFFQLKILLRTVERDSQVMFKHDGNRFDTSQITLKLHSNTEYKWIFKCKPVVNFCTLVLSGKEVKLTSIQPGEYMAIWNTTGMEQTSEGCRDEIRLILSGPEASLQNKVQVKFYGPTDTHAEWGQKMDALTWNCYLDKQGEVAVLDEQITY